MFCSLQRQHVLTTETWPPRSVWKSLWSLSKLPVALSPLPPGGPLHWLPARLPRERHQCGASRLGRPRHARGREPRSRVPDMAYRKRANLRISLEPRGADRADGGRLPTAGTAPFRAGMGAPPSSRKVHPRLPRPATLLCWAGHRAPDGPAPLLPFLRAREYLSLHERLPLVVGLSRDQSGLMELTDRIPGPDRPRLDYHVWSPVASQMSRLPEQMG